jgi:integrase
MTKHGCPRSFMAGSSRFDTASSVLLRDPKGAGSTSVTRAQETNCVRCFGFVVATTGEPPTRRACVANSTSISRAVASAVGRPVPCFAPYELRHTFATRLSAGGVADHMVMRMLRQSDAEIFTLYSQAKLGMMREALAKLDRQANERSEGL